MNLDFSIRLPVRPLAASPENLRLINAQDDGFRAMWLAFLGEFELLGFRHHPAVAEYYTMLSAPSSRDLSFIVSGPDGPLALALLWVETVDGRVQGSWIKGGFLPHPIFHPRLGTKQLRALENYVFEVATDRLVSVGATRWNVETDVLSAGTDAIEDQMLARLGALEVSIQSQIMDLSGSDENIWKQLRHSSKSLINKGLKEYEFKVYDQDNFTLEIGDRHRLLHHKCSGRITRPIATFNKMYSWVQEGCGLMFEQLHKGQTVQMIFVALGRGTACGASAADDPDFKSRVPLTHSMNYFIYQETRRRGIRLYEVGETSFRDSLFNRRSEKFKSICDSKSWIWTAHISMEAMDLVLFAIERNRIS